MRVLVAGGGIGGLTAATVLRRRGFDVRVYEQAPQLRSEGAGLALWANATAVLNRLGLREVVDSVGGPFDDVDAMTAAGHVVNTTDFSGVAERYGSPARSRASR